MTNVEVKETCPDPSQSKIEFYFIFSPLGCPLAMIESEDHKFVDWIQDYLL